MAYEEALRTITCEAASDLSASQYRFVSLNSSNQIALTGAGLQADGVLQNKPALQGRAATVATGGTSKVVAGAAVTKGDNITSDSTGRAVTASGADVVMGVARDSAAGAAVIIPVLLQIG